ncbi:MAG: diacylglycerol kinase family protein [Cyclobacteriaceae bacterium]|jgi:diacylglycerol kinase (ATP)
MLKFLKSLRAALSGIRYTIQSQRNFQIQSVVGMLVIGAASIVRVSAIEWCVLLFCIALVLGLELINTSIEELVNLVHPNWSEKAGRIKDIAAGAVLLAAFFSAVVGLVIFVPYLLR